MIIAIVFAHVWGVIQLTVLSSLARTVSVRTVLAALVAGVYACALLAVFLGASFSRPAAWLIGMDFSLFRDIASHSVDPFIEEIVKVLPVLVLLAVPVIRRQWSITDYVLVSAAAGAGLGLAEDLYRHGSAAGRAVSESNGWTLNYRAISLPFVPDISTTLTSWLPPGVASRDAFFPGRSGYPWVNLHLAWSAIGGLAVGLIRLHKGRVGVTIGALLLLYVAADHAAFNVAGSRDWLALGLRALPFGALRDLLPLMPVAALAAAFWLDRGRQRGLEPLLAVEQSASPRVLGTFRAAASELPWSLPRLSKFVRMRRAYNSTRASGSGDDTERLRAVVVDAQDRLEQEPAQLKSPPWLASFRQPAAALAVIRRPMVLVWLVLMTPSILWFVVGGWPQTAGVQTMLMGPVAWRVVVVLSAVSQALAAWYLVISIRAWPTARRLPVGDDAAIFGLRIAGQLGALSLGGYALFLAFTGQSPTHALPSLLCAYCSFTQQALGSALMLGGAPLSLLGTALPAGADADPSNEQAAPSAAAAVPAAKEPWEKAEARQTAPSSPSIGTVAANPSAPSVTPGPQPIAAPPSWLESYMSGGDSGPGDAAPGDGAPVMSPAEEAAWAAEVASAAEADARDAAAAANAAESTAAKSNDAWSRANRAMVEEAQKGLSDEAKAGTYGGATPEQNARLDEEKRVMREATRADLAAQTEAIRDAQAAEAARLRAAVAEADAAVARARANSEAAHVAYLADMAAASAADAAATAADPGATPHAALDVNDAAKVAKKELDAKIAAANAAKAVAEGVEAAKQAQWKHDKP